MAWLIALAGCERFDLRQPIDVVPASNWTSFERETLAAGARCWQLRFGIDFEVVAQPRHDQVVYFDFAALACWESLGRYLPGDLPGDPSHDSVCPLPDIRATLTPGYVFDAMLFTVVTHELGHVANIGDVYDDRTSEEQLTAVMGGFTTPSSKWPCIQLGYEQGCGPAFTPYDAQVLAAANPGFSPTPACDDVDLVADSVTEIACGCR